MKKTHYKNFDEKSKSNFYFNKVGRENFILLDKKKLILS